MAKELLLTLQPNGNVFNRCMRQLLVCIFLQTSHELLGPGFPAMLGVWTMLFLKQGPPSWMWRGATSPTDIYLLLHTYLTISTFIEIVRYDSNVACFIVGAPFLVDLFDFAWCVVLWLLKTCVKYISG